MCRSRALITPINVSNHLSDKAEFAHELRGADTLEARGLQVVVLELYTNHQSYRLADDEDGIAAVIEIVRELELDTELMWY